LVSSLGIVSGISSPRSDWLDTKFSGVGMYTPGGVNYPNTVYGGLLQRQCNIGGPAPGGTTDLSPYVSSCNVIYVSTPTGAINFTLPATNAGPVSWASALTSEITMVIQPGNTAYTHTFGTGFVSNGPVTTGTTFTQPSVVLFRLSSIAGQSTWVEYARSGGSFTASSTIANLPACSSGTNAGLLMMITNGVASPTYNSAVSTTGSTNNLVFCNGSGWTYH
jgi:hypothetical protein